MAFGADDKKDARGMATVDIDNDGDLDLVINTNPGDCGKESVSPAVLRNDIGNTRNVLVVNLKGTNSNHDAIGALVTIETKPGDGEQPLKLTRHVHCGSGYASQSDLRLFFGLANHTEVKSMQVRWPNGKTQEFDTIPANSMVRLIEGGKLDITPIRAKSEVALR